jgi:hypothetical protein
VWNEGPHNGGLEVLDYRVNMRLEGGEYSVIAYVVTIESYTATGLTLGATYEFTVEARNEIGYSSSS